MRTAIGPPEFSVAPRIRPRRHPPQRDRGFESTSLQRRVLQTFGPSRVAAIESKKCCRRWVTDPALKPIQLFAEGKIDAFFGFPPEPQELRARKVGNVILATTVDRPWWQYFCCMLAGNPEYVRNYPVATRRVLRAILKATEFCATDPLRAAQRIVDRGFTSRYDYAIETLRSGIPYDKWHEYDAEDSIRSYALRMRDAGISIKGSSAWRAIGLKKRPSLPCEDSVTS